MQDFIDGFKDESSDVSLWCRGIKRNMERQINARKVRACYCVPHTGWCPIACHVQHRMP